MNAILNWGIDVVLWCQQFSPTLDVPFKIFTSFGEELFFLLFIPLIIWCVDYSIGIRMAILFLFSAYLNSLAKIIAAQPRPFQLSSEVKMLVEETTGGLPSGHTQNATVVWCYLASQFKKKGFWILSIILLIFIPLSRIYLGVHFPTDILGGYLLGFIILLIFFRLEQPIAQWLKHQTIAIQLTLATLIPVLLILASIGHLHETSATSATILGGSIGLVIERKYIGFQTTGAWWKRILRFLCGTIILGIIYFGFKSLFYGMEPYILFRFIRYALVGISVFLLIPWIFIKLKIA